MANLRTLAACVVLVGGVLAGSAAQASVTVYTDKASFDAATTTSLLEDFSSAPTKDAPLASLTLHGVTYTGLDGAPFPNVFVSSPGYTNYGADVGTTTDFILTANGDEDILATFSTTYTAIGFNAFFNGLGDIFVTIRDTASNPLLFLTVGLDPANFTADKGFLGFVSDTPIGSFEWDSTAGGRLNTGFTNIAVGAAGGVPEPAAWSLLLMGFLGLGAALRGTRRLAVA